MPASRRGTGFIGLQQYLGLNQGAARRMGDELTDSLEADAAKFRSQVDAATQDFADQTSVGQMPVDPAAATNEQLRSLAGATYTGPEALSAVADTGALRVQEATIGNKYGALGSNAGRAALLAQQNPGQGYGWGSQALDAALVGAGGGAALNRARGGWEALKGYLGRAESGAAEQAKQAAQRTQETAQWARGELTPTRQAERMPMRELTPREEAAQNRPGYKPRPGGNKYGGGY